MQIIFASSNAGKIAELQALFADSSHEFIATNNPKLPAIEVSETGSTFSENALLKAQAYAEKYQLPTLADDSGLEVVTLNNEPGVASNRWFEGTDEQRNQALLNRLQNATSRAARFITVACLFFPETSDQHYFEGAITGTISPAPSGTSGFGYDPLFIPEGHSHSFAELGPAVKNRLSHRAQAFTLVKQFLETHD